MVLQLSREAAWQLLNEYTKNPNLIKHALAVEACMRRYAEKFGEDVEKWSVVGLLHDFDYEQHPTAEEHPFVGAEILRTKGYPEDVVQAVLGHANYTGVARETLMAKTLYACDELSGLVVAVALVRPNKSIHEVTVKSVKKKLKDKAFARGVNREDIYQGVAELGVALEEHIQFVIEALQSVAVDLGLAGSGKANTPNG